MKNVLTFVRNKIKTEPIEDGFARRFQLLRGLLVVFTPLAILILFARQLLLPNDINNTIILVICGFGILGIMYWPTKTRNYNLSITAVLFLGFTVILVNAALSSPPHMEIAYIIIVPLLATVMFNLWETFIISSLCLVSTVIFIIMMPTIPQSSIYDILTLVTIVLAFILYAAYERNRLEKERQILLLKNQENILLRQFLSNVSHDLKTPLSIINTSLYLLEKDNGDTEKHTKRVHRIHEQSKRLEKLIEDMLLMSRLGNTEINSNLEWLNINDIIRSIVADFQSTFQDKHLHYEFKCETIPLTFLNRENIHILLKNVIENAIIYSNLDGSVKIETNVIDKFLCINITDNGIGISPIDLPHIYEHFYRADLARSTYTGGAGLGLSIVKRIVEMHEGSIMIESVENKGTRVTIKLPLSPVSDSNMTVKITRD